MSGESFQEQLRRLKRTLAELDERPPGQRPADMPRTQGQRLAELEAIKRHNGLDPARSAGSSIGGGPQLRSLDEPPPKPLFVWLVDGVKVMASERPAGGLSLVEAQGDGPLSGLHR